MRILELTLENYAGIYNGLELDKITIDFSKCRHKICLIKGDNGSGKSTIMKALKPLPEGNESFIPGRRAYKRIVYFNTMTNESYALEFIHEVNAKGERMTPKAHIYHTNNLVSNDLNPSGNVTSAKEIIFNLFNLDPCYLSLMQLTSNKRGMADMKPAERKKFVNSILNNVDAYNDMYKALSKKTVVYKGLISNLESRLSTIGDITKLDIEYGVLNKNITEYEEVLDGEKELKNKAEAVIIALDPTGTLRQEFKKITSELDNHYVNSELLKEQLEEYKEKYNIIGDVSDSVDKLKASLNKQENDKSNLENHITELLKQREVDTIELSTKTAKLKDINEEHNLEEYKLYKKAVVVKKHDIEQSVYSNTGIDIKNGIPFSRDMLVNSITVLSQVKGRLTEPDFANMDFLSECMEEFGHARDGEISSKSILQASIKVIKTKNEELEKLKSIKREMEVLKLSFEDVLNERPKTCKIDDCSFIKNAVAQKAKYDEYASMHVDDRINECICTINKAEQDKEFYENVENGYKELCILREKINAIRPFINSISDESIKKPLDSIFSYQFNRNLMQNINNFNHTVEFLYEHIDMANSFEEYKECLRQIAEYDKMIEKLTSNETLINLLSTDIDKLNASLSSTLKEIEDSKQHIAILDMNIEKTKQLIKTWEAYIKVYNENKEEEKAIAELLKTKKKMEFDQDRLFAAYKTIEDGKGKVDEVLNILNPLRKKKNDIETTIKLASSYIEELKQHKNILNKLEVIKYYTSPTTGIQLIFASIYLSKILDKANAILSTLFGGIFNLLQFVITEDEFRIPVAVQGGLNHDDITSMSSAQIALISMIISISMLSQASTTMNIIVGDEIDASLDPENRRRFFDILVALMDLIHSEQSVLISHNSEYTQNECDVIWLRNQAHVNEEGNVIWSYD